MWLILICGVLGWNRECETDDFDLCNCTGAITPNPNLEKAYHVSVIPSQQLFWCFTTNK